MEKNSKSKVSFFSIFKKRVLYKQIIFAFCAMFLCFFLWLKYIDIYTHHDEHIVLPDFYGVHIQDLDSVCQELDLRYIIIDSVFNKKEEKGIILEHDNKVLIEQFIDGIEISCGIFTHQEIEVLPLTEIVSHNDFFDFEAKYKGLSDEITPGRISRKETENVQKITKHVYKELGLKGIVRIDYIIMKGIPYLIEINTIPGLSVESIIPKQAKEAGYKLSELFELTIENTINK